MKKCVFMIGERRSGTNLLRLLLSENKEVVAPHMVALLDKMMPVNHCYDPKSARASLEQMISDARHLINLVPAGWSGPELSCKALAPRCHDVSVVSVLVAIMDLCAEVAGVPVCVHKEPKALTWHQAIAARVKNPRYIFLYRDPRDVVLSFSRLPDGEKHPYAIAQHWASVQKLCLDTTQHLPPHVVHFVRYEDLVREPARVLSSLCDFIGVTYCDSMLDFHRHEEARRVARHGSHWGKVAQPVSESNIGKYQKELAPEDIEIVEFAAGEQMSRLGYQRSGTGKVYTPVEISAFLEANDQAKRAVIGGGHLNHIRAQREFINNIKSRHGKEG